MTTVAMAGGLMPPQASNMGINQPDRAPADGCLTSACSEASALCCIASHRLMLVGSVDSPYHRLLACMQRNSKCNSSRADTLGCRGMDAVMLDDCNFHQSVSLDRFETERLLELVPPDGEFAVMNYRSTYPFKPPFRVQTVVEDDANTALKVSIILSLLLCSAPVHTVPCAITRHLPAETQDPWQIVA